MAWIGQLGSKAVAGVGVGGMYIWLSQGLASMSRMGGQVQVAQYIGRGDWEEAHGYPQAAVQLSLLTGLAFSAMCVIFLHPLVGFFKLTDPEALDAAFSYTRVACGLLVFSFLTLTLTGLYTAQGDSKTPFVANFIGLLINLLLDPLLILGVGPFPRIEVAGAAVATVSAQFVVMFVMMVGVFRSKKEENVLKGIRLFEPFSKEELGNICKIGGPTAIQGMVYCMISMVLTRMVAAFGAEAIATQRVGGQIESVSWNTADGFAAALNAFVGQNYGAKKMDRVQKGYRIFWTVAIWGVLIMLAFILFPGPIAGVFFHEEKAMEIAISYLIIIGFSEAFMCVELMTIGALSGLGKTKLCSVISITATSMRIPLAMVLSRTSLGLDGIWWALTLTSVAKGIIFYLTFRYQMREKC